MAICPGEKTRSGKADQFGAMIRLPTFATNRRDGAILWQRTGTARDVQHAEARAE